MVKWTMVACKSINKKFYWIYLMCQFFNPCGGLGALSFKSMSLMVRLIRQHDSILPLRP